MGEPPSSGTLHPTVIEVCVASILEGAPGWPGTVPRIIDTEDVWGPCPMSLTAATLYCIVIPGGFKKLCSKVRSAVEPIRLNSVPLPILLKMSYLIILAPPSLIGLSH